MGKRHNLNEMLDHSQIENKEGHLTCARCREEKIVVEFAKDISKARGYSYICKPCKSALSSSYPKPSKEVIHERNVRNYHRNKEKRIEGIHRWMREVDGRSRTIILNSRSGAKKRNLEHSIVFDDVKEMFEKQEMRCCLTGFEFDMNPWKGNPYGPSIDRIDSSKGYIKGNIRLVCFAVNIGLSNFGTETYIEICKAVVNLFKEETR